MALRRPDRTGCAADRNSMKRPRSRNKKQTFSVVKAVKLNARSHVGTPPPERVLPDPKDKRAFGPEKHKTTLAELLTPREE